ncbi:WXG100 family type VII secretion target [Streptomyces tendae]
MADGPKRLSPGEFEVALGDLQRAIGKVRGLTGDLHSDLDQIGATFARLHTEWRSPAEATSEPVTEWFKRVSGNLYSLLDEIVRRMQVSYDTYRDVEEANSRNAAGGGGPHSGDHQNKQQNNASKHQHVAVQDKGTEHPVETALRAGVTPPAEGTGLRNMVTAQGDTDG